MASNDFIIRIVLDAQSKIAPVMAAASAEAKKLENQINGADRAAASLDKSLTQLDGHVTRMRDTFRSVNPTLDSLDRKMKGISETSTVLGRNFGVVTRASEKAGAALGALGGIVERLDKKLTDLDRKMEEMGTRTYSPKIGVDGIEAVDVHLDALSKKLLELERKRRTVRIGIEQEILDREIAEVEAKFDALGAKGHERYFSVKFKVDDESARLVDDKARAQTKLFEDQNARRLESNRKAAQSELDDLRAQLAKDDQLRAAAEQEDINRQADAEARRHERLQREESDQAATVQRIEQEIKASEARKSAARDRNEREETAYNQRRRAQVAAQGDRAVAASTNLDDDTRSVREVKVDKASLAVAREEIARLGGVDLKVGVKLSPEDRAVLEAQLARIGLKKEHIKVVLDYNRNDAEVLGSRIGQLFQAGFNRAQKSAEGGGGGSNFLSSGGLRTAAIQAAALFAEPLLSAITAVAGALISVASAAAEAGAGLAGMATAGAAQALPVFGLLALAGTRVAAVIKASTLAQAERDKGSQQGLGVDKARQNAADALAAAHRGVKDALDALANAERNVGDAQLAVIAAQDALNAARKEGIRTLEDLQMAERRASLSADESELALSMRQAAGGGGLVQSAQLQAEGDRTDATRATADNAVAQAGGINGLPAVVSAQKGVDQAKRSLDDANRAVDKAAEGVARAREQVAKAAEGVGQAGDKMGAAASAYAIALSHLSEGERTLLRSVEAFKKLFDAGSDMRKVSDIIVLSFSRSLDKVASLFRDPEILRAASQLATGIAKSIDSVATFLTTGPMRTALLFFTNQASKNIGTVGKIFENLIAIFTNVAMAASGSLSSSLKGVNGWLAGIADKTSPAKAAGLRNFFQDALDPIKAFLGLGGALTRLFLAIAGQGGAADEGTNGIKRLTTTINGATKWVQAHAKEVRNFFRESVNATSDVLRVVVALGRALVQSFDPKAVHGFADFLNKTVIPVLVGFVKVMGLIDRAIFAVFNNDTVAAVVRFAAPFGLVLLAITKIELAFGRLITWFSRGRIAAALYTTATEVMTAATMVFAGEATILEGVLLALEAVNPFVWVAAAIIAVYELYKHVKIFHEAVDAVLAFVRDHWKTILVLFTGPLGAVLLALIAFGPKILHTISGAFNSVKSWISGAAGTLFDPLKGPFEKLKKWADDAFGYVGKKVSGILGSLGIVDSEADKRKKKVAAEQKLEAELAPLNSLPTNYRVNSDGQQRLGGQQQPSARASKKDSATAKINKQLDYFQTVDAKVSPEEATQIKKLWQDIVRSTDASTKQIASSVRAMRVGIEATVDRLVRVVDKNFDDMNHAARTAWHDFNDSASKNLKTFTDNFSDAMQKASKAAFDGFSYIADAANKALKAYDAKPVNISLAPPAAEHKATGGRVGQVAGWVGQMGERGADAVHTILGRGEAVINWAQQPLVNAGLRAIGVDGLDGLFKNVRGEHGAAAPGGLATGGRAGGANFNGHPENVSGPIRSLIGQMEDRFPKLQVTSTTDHGLRSSSGGISFHSSGRAVDMAADPGYMNMVAGWIKSSGFYKKLAEGIHNPNLAVKYGKLVDGPTFYASGGVWGQHLDHIHLALTEGIGKLAAGLGGDTNIKTPKIVGGGVLGTTTQAVLKALAGRANSTVDKASQTSDIHDDGPAGGGAAASPAIVRQWATEALRHTNHFSSPNLNALVGRIMFESGGNPKAVNRTDSNAAAGHPSKGLGQTIDATFESYRDKALPDDIFDPIANLVASIKYMFARYGHIMGNTGQGYASGGFAGIAKSMGLDWGGMQAKGGDYTVTKPTMFVAGDAGAERATFQPLASGGVAGGGKTNDPLTILKTDLSRFQGFGDVAGIDALLDDVSASISKINEKILSTAKPRTKAAGDALDAQLTKMGKALDFLASDQGPLALFEQQITNAANRAARLVTNSQFARGKNGILGRTSISDDTVAVQEVENLKATRSGLNDELKDINGLLRDARDGLRRARTEAQRQLFRGTISTLVGKREAVADTLAANAQSIVERRESAQQASLDAGNTIFDRQRAGLDLTRRVNTALGRPEANADLFTTQINIARTQISDLTLRMRAAAKIGNTKLVAAIQTQINELNTSIVELSVQRVTEARDAIMATNERYNAWAARSFKAAQILGVPGADVALASQNIVAAQATISQLQGTIGAAMNTGNGTLVQSIYDQIKDLENSIVELTASRIQSAIDQVNSEADRRTARLAISQRYADLRTQAGDAMGGLVESGRLLQSTRTSLQTQRAGLWEQADQAQATGNVGLYDKLIDQLMDIDASLAENAQAIKDNTFATRKLSVDIINNDASRATGLLGSVKTIFNALSSITGTSTVDDDRSVLQSTGSVLQTQGAGLAGQARGASAAGEFGGTGSSILTQLVNAFTTGPREFGLALQGLAPTIAAFESTLGPAALAAFQGLVDGMTSNTVATTENTAALAGLDSSVSQTFSSTAWTTFRQAIFDGNGGLLPDYQLPGLSAASATVGSATMPTSRMTPMISTQPRATDGEAKTGVNIENFNTNITNPTNTYDADYIGKKQAWSLATAGRS